MARLNDLISRSALLEFAHNHVGGMIDCNDIARFPAIDAAPVVHARWEGLWNGLPGYTQMHCTACNKWIRYTDGFMDGFPKYCPNCGTKMDGGAKE